MPRVWKFGDQINTDDILPGKYAPFMVGEDRFHLYAFAHLRPEFAKEVRPGDILVFGRNAGLGSSREYAPEALKRLGVRAIIAKSYARTRSVAMAVRWTSGRPGRFSTTSAVWR